MADITKLRKYAATMMSMIMPVDFIVPSSASRSIGQFSVRFHAASARPAITPSEAASVGVAMPA